RRPRPPSGNGNSVVVQRIGFIGLGRMGSRMAKRLLEADLQLTVFDADRARAQELVTQGANVGESPRAVAAGSEAVITSVTDGVAVLALLSGEDGLLAGAPPNLLLIEMSTIGVEDSRRVATACAAAGLRYVRAPVLGTLDAAEEGSLNALISG